MYSLINIDEKFADNNKNKCIDALDELAIKISDLPDEEDQEIAWGLVSLHLLTMDLVISGGMDEIARHHVEFTPLNRAVAKRAIGKFNNPRSIELGKRLKAVLESSEFDPNNN